MTTEARTSFLESTLAAIEAADFGHLDLVGQRLWIIHGAGHLTDDDATLCSAAIEARRKSNRPPPTVGQALRPKLTFKRAPTQRSPDKARSIARRRQLAASGPMPPSLAANFTTCELAALKVISDEVAIKGFCDLDIPQIAARAGTCASIVRNAVRCAEGESMIRVVRRPRPGRKNLTNLVTIIRAEWLDWIRKHPIRRPSSGNAAPLIPTRPIGCKNVEATGSDIKTKDKNGVWRPKGIGNRTAASRG
jgi:hypothetical protein